jgi:S1-C subfamily serine protease
MKLRNPRWGDAAYVFGYPRVQRTTEDDITMHSGRVVNPAEDVRKLKFEPGEVVNPGKVVYDPPERRKVFLYSSTTRPGNSGGPIVAADGSVIGLVVEHSAPAKTSDVNATSDDDKPSSAPFYFGIPSSEVMRALKQLDFSGLALFEDWT